MKQTSKIHIFLFFIIISLISSRGRNYSYSPNFQKNHVINPTNNRDARQQSQNIANSRGKTVSTVIPKNELDRLANSGSSKISGNLVKMDIPIKAYVTTTDNRGSTSTSSVYEKMIVGTKGKKSPIYKA